MRVAVRAFPTLLITSILTSLVVAAAPAEKTDPKTSAVQRGEYLTLIMSCNDCHTPFKMGAKGPEPDVSRMLSGHPQDLTMPPAPALGQGPWAWAGAGTMTAFAGPWGVSYSINLTPDKETGLGSWNEEMFVQALRTGRHQGRGRPVLPPMPWQQIRHATDEDLRAIWAYLQTIPAIRNQVPQPIEPAEAAPAPKGSR